MTWQTEFPDFPAADMPAIPDGLGFVDTSWHNDAMPSFTSDEAECTIWIDFATDDQREHSGGSRFQITPQRHGVEISGDGLDTDDWAEVVTYVTERHREITSRR